MSEWFKKNIRGLGNTYMNGGNTVAAIEPKEPGILDSFGSALSNIANSLEENMENNPMYNDPNLMGFADRVLSANPNDLVGDNNTYAGSLVNAGVGGAAGVFGGIADLLGADTLGNRMHAIAEATRDKNEIPADLDWDYITSPHGLARSTGNMLGSMAAIAPAAAFLPESAALGITSGIARLGGNRVVQSLVDHGFTNLAKQVSTRLPMAVQWSSTMIPESLAEGGNVVRSAREQGLDDPYIRGWKTAAENAPGLFASKLLEGLTLGGAFMPKPGAGILRKGATIPLTAGAEGIQNAGEEAYQQAVQNLNTDRPLGEGVKEAAAEGFWGSLLLGGLGGAANATGNHVNFEDTQEYKDWANGAAGNQDYSNIDLSDVPMQDIEDDGLAATNNTLKANFRNLFDWAKDAFGKEVEVSGGARSAEHNAEVNGSPTSHHLNGNAIDVNVSMLSDDEREAFIQKAKEMGFNSDGDDFYHDRGSGYHVHLTYMDNGNSAGTGQREGHENAWAIYDVFRQAGYNDNAIAGILGRVQQEHNFDTSNVEEYDDEQGRHLGGYGMFQWNGGRTTDFLSWAQDNNLDPQSPTVQAQYALLEAQQRGITPEKMNSLSAEDAADVWTKEWEVGEPGEERTYAGEWLGRIKNGGGVSPGTKGTSTPKTPKAESYQELESMYEGFAKELIETSQNPEDIDYFNDFFDSKGKFQGTKENLEKIRERTEGDLADEFKDYAERQKAKQESQKAQVAPDAPKIETEADNLNALKERLNAMKEDAVKNGDFDTATKINTALKTGDLAAMQSLAGVKLENVLNTPENTQAVQPSTQAQPVQQTQSAGQPGRFQNSSSRRWRSDEFSPTSLDGGRKVWIASTIKGRDLADSYTPEQISRIEEEAKKYNGELIQYHGNTLLGFKTPEDSKNFRDEMNRQTNNGNQEHPMFQASQPVQTPQPTQTAQAVQPQSTQAQQQTNPVPTQPQQAAIPAQPAQSQGQAQSAPNKTIEERDNDIINKAYENGMVPVAGTKPERRKQGKGLIRVASAAGLNLPSNLQNGLRNGSKKAIAEAQDIVRRDIPNIEALGGIRNENPESTETTPQESTSNAENQNQNAEFGQTPEAQVTATGNASPVPTQAKKEPKALAKFRENVAKVVDDYRKDKISYEDAARKIFAMDTQAENGAPDEDTRQAIRQVAEEGINQLNAIYEEKEAGTPSQTAQDSAGEAKTSGQEGEPTQEEKSAQNEPEPTQATVEENLKVETASNERGEKSAQNAVVAENASTDNKTELHFADLEKAMKASGRNVLIRALDKGYKPVGDNTLEAPDGTRYVLNDKAYNTFEKDYQNRQGKENPATEDYSSMTLEELKAERQKQIDEEVDRWNRNPGGKGTNNQLIYSEYDTVTGKPTGDVVGRTSESNNPEWYQWAYKRAGNKKPAKRDYPMYADEYLRNIQEYDELVREIERREAEAKQEEDVSVSAETKQETPAKKQEPVVLKGIEGLWESTIEDYIDRGFGIESYKGHKEGKTLVYDITFESEQERQRFIDDYYGESEEDDEITEDDYKAEEPAQEEPAGEKKPAKESIFGDEAENENDLLEALGITEGETEEVSFGNEFGDTTDEEIEALKKELQKELSKLSVNPVFNPKIYTLGLQLGGKYIQKGYRTFKKWMEKMKGDLGEPIEPWAPAIWETLKTYPKGQKFDPKQIMAFSKLIGSKFERGVTSLEDVNADMKKLLKGRYKEFAPMIEASYNGIEKYFSTIKEGENNVNDSTRGLASRTGEGVNQDAVGRNDESGRPGRGSKREGGQKAESDVQQQGSTGIYDSSTPGSGKAGNSGVQAEESANGSGSTGNTELSRSVRDSYERSVALDDGRKAENIDSAEERPVNAADQEVGREKENTSYKAGDLDSIKADLPMLRPEQQEDVQRIEKRLLVDEGQGFLCTNGTGTGKTYSGLGVIKRMHDQGKKNILVVVPSAEIARQWVEAAKRDFSLDMSQLANTKDNGGKGVCITTYANFQANKELVARDWDMVVADESHKLLENKDASETSALKMLRSITKHPRQIYNRWKLKNRTKKIRSFEDKIDECESKLTKLKKDYDAKKVSESVYSERSASLKDTIKQTEKAITEEYRSMNDQWEEVEKQWEAIPSEDKPKVLFMSATPFAYDKSIDYAEGYLFNYNEDTNPGSYHNQSGFEQFMMQKFGYRFRYGKLTKPDTQVDNRVMEIQFHDELVNAGVMHGRQIALPVDYDRGFLLVDGGVGNKIDEGFKFLWDNHKKYGKLADALRKQFDTRAKRYLIESIKAKAVVPIVQEYIKSGKKVVLFHQSMKEKHNIHPFQLKSFGDRQVTEQWELFKKERPDLVGLRLDDIPAPMTTLQEAFKDALYLDGSQEHKKTRDNAVKLFQDDDSGKNLIICQQDAANAGVSLHDITGKHQRVLINIATPERPTYAMQIEGRIYRVGSATNAIFRYLSTGTELEKSIFADTIGSRAETAENLALGADARGLRDSFTNLFMETLDGSWERRKPGHPEEGTGGKEMDFSGKSDVTLWERAKSFYYGQQKKTSSTKAKEGKDYFATPEPVGLKMVEWLGLKDGDSALEPSAGHGAISRWLSPNTSNTIVEPSGTLAPLAQMVTPDAKVVRTGFEDFNIVNKFDGIAMNPPFGAGGKTAVEHLAKAFRHLKDGGRVVAIIPTGPSADAHFNKWLYGENKKGEQVQEPVKGAVLTADIKLPSVTFNRAGTGVATRIVVIDKHNNADNEQKAYSEGGVSIELTGIKDINELFDRMENMTVPERVKGKTASQKAKENSQKESAPRDSYEGEIDGTTITIHQDGRITGKTYGVKDTIKANGGKWDRNEGVWRINAPAKLSKFINKYNTDGATVEEKEEDTSTAFNVKESDGQYIANVKDKLEYDTYKYILEFAKEHGGDYKKGKGFVFDNEADLNEFVEVADALLGMGDADTQGFQMITAPEGVKESPEADAAEQAEGTKEEKTSSNRKYSLDGKSINAGSRSVSELKAEAKDAFPNAKVEDKGDTLVMTMPNGQKVTVALHESIEVSDDELSLAKSAHGFDKGASVTIEGYAETVNGDGFIALSQGSREGTGFHEAYHIAEAMAFTKKELANAKRLVSENEEERANAYAKWKLARQKHSNFAKLWQKIADVAAKMAGILGYETKRNLFRKVEIGEIYKRDNTAKDTEKKYSVNSSEGSSEQSFLARATDALAKKMGVKPTSDRVKVDERPSRDKGFKPVIDYIFSSPSRIAERNKAFKLFYNMADKAMNLLTKNRTEFNRKFDKAWSLCKSQDERNTLNEVLVTGDAEEKEYTKDEILAMGGTENVAEAYKQIRSLIRKSYNLVNEARKRPTPHSRRLANDEINKLRENPFIEIQKISDAEDGKKLVTYKEYANWTKEYDVTPDELQQFENDKAIQILEQDENEDGTIHLKVREGISDLANKKGYVPHVFHEYMVRVKDEEGNIVDDYGYGGVIASGRNESEAIAKAEEWLKNNNLKDGETIHVAPKVFSFQSLGMDEGQYAAVMGDKDFNRMVEGIAEHNEISLAEAKELVKGSAKKKNRHRFFGHTLQRHGAKGYEQDMQWALRHYFNSAVRYHAMETEFKPQAISLFERLFGDFDKKHTGLAKYVQDYIGDINGNPSELEQTINEFLNQSPAWRKLVVSKYGDRAALRAVNSVTRTMSYLCLGFLNTSSALLNFSQTINAAAYLGNPKYAPMIIANGMKRKYTQQEMKVLIETNVGNDIGLDSGSGYDRMRSFGGLWNAIGDKGMILFKKSERCCRFGATLVAYKKARANGKTHDQAIAYAKEINRKSNFDYSVADAPNIFRRGSIIAQIALQFKKYGIKEMEVVADMFPTNSKTTKAQKAIFWGMYLLTAGLLQVPLFNWWDKLFGGKDAIQKYIMEATGDSPFARQLAITAMYGISANAGIDMSRRVGLADVIPSEGRNLVPPAINKPISFAQDMAAGNYANAVRDFSPGLYNQYAAWIAGESEGGRGRTNSVYNDMYSKILRSAGFTSTDERIASDIQRITYNQKDEKAKEKQQAIDEFIENPTNENAKRLKELGVKPSTVKKERERKKRSKLDRIKVDMSKEEMKRNKDLFRFAE